MKFGVSKSAKKRRTEIQVGVVEELTVVSETASMPRSKAFELEWLMHKSLGKYRLRGEWFSLCPKTLGVAQLLKAKTPIELLTYFCGTAEQAVVDSIGDAANFHLLHSSVKTKLSWGQI